jgi:hypothetical protein
MGFRYTSYRIWHEIEKRFGFLKKKHPLQPDNKYFISLGDWRTKSFPFTIEERENLFFEKNKNESLKENTQKILKGEICFFSSEWKYLGTNYNWITNPDTGFQYDSSHHWSEISDFNLANGDIKYVWEKSRFTYLLTIIRNDYHFDEDHSQFIFDEIESWINANPINQGPNWKCSQEISLRLFNWMYALQFYKNSDALNEELWNKIQNVIYWSLHHIYHHINFSRIAVRNNHAITETLALTISELLFPFIPETKKWAKQGRKWLEQEVAYQVYDDGTFLQFSMNYHRVLIQLFSLGISITETHKKPFSQTFYKKAYKSLTFLYECLQDVNGFLPNYGANDGALFFPLSNTEYRDYRSQLNGLHIILTNHKLYDDLEFNEEYHWVQKKSSFLQKLKPLERTFGTFSYPIGGYYLCRTSDHFTFIRCGNHKNRPSHADNLHMDVWVKGENIIRDSGSYKYNTTKELSDYFTGTAGHNAVMVNNESQMLKGSRFIWYYWSQVLSANWSENDDFFIFTGEISAFRHLNRKGVHKREIKIVKSGFEWIVEDEILNLENYDKKQFWHFDDNKVALLCSNNELITDEISFNSSYYGEKKVGKSVAVNFKRGVQTKIKYTN